MEKIVFALAIVLIWVSGFAIGHSVKGEEVADYCRTNGTFWTNTTKFICHVDGETK